MMAVKRPAIDREGPHTILTHVAEGHWFKIVRGFFETRFTVAIDVAIGGKADIACCGANVCF
jgi:hypothetical protein